MAVTLIFRVSNLLSKFLTNTFVLFCSLQSAGTIASCTLQSIPDHLYHFFIVIQPNCHKSTSLLFLFL